MKAGSDSHGSGALTSPPVRAFPDLRGEFPILAANPELHYLDSAATSQKPHQVLNAIREYYESANANPHRGAYRLSVRATDLYHGARHTVARFLGVSDPDTLIFTRGTTEGINLIASSYGAGIKAGDEIVVTGMEHHANFVPWQQLALRTGALFRICELTADQELDLEMLAALVNERTRVVAFAHVSNATGAINPVSEIVRIVRAASPAVIVCDAAQSVPHLGVHFDTLGVDFMAFSGHKMLGPMGIGGVVARRELLQSMPPYQMGGDMIEFVHDTHTTWNVLPHKFEAGTPNVGDAVGMAAAADYLANVGMQQVRKHELALLTLAQDRLAQIPEVTIYGPSPERRSGVVSFNVGAVHPHDLATILDTRNVCIRAGHHCTQPLMRRLGVAATARASFFVYSSEDDVEALAQGVEAAAKLLG